MAVGVGVEEEWTDLWVFSHSKYLKNCRTYKQKCSKFGIGSENIAALFT